MRLIAGQKPCPGSRSGPAAATPFGVASLKASLWWCSRYSARDSPGETLIRLGIGRGRRSCVAYLLGPRLGCPTGRRDQWCELVLTVASSLCHRLGGARPRGRRRCWSGGSGLSPPPCCVEVFECRLWLLGRRGRRLVWSAASGPVCCVLSCIGFRSVFLINWSFTSPISMKRQIFCPVSKKKRMHSP